MGEIPAWVYVLVPPIYISAGLIVVRTIRDWGGIMARWNERRRDKAQIEHDQIERMDGRMQALEQALMEARDYGAIEHAGRLQAEALLMARQIADQGAQIIVSAEREIDAIERRLMGRGEDNA